MAILLALILGIVAVAVVAAAPPAPPVPLPPAGYPVASGRVPILYEAYYPEPREWSPQASLKEIDKLSELTRQLLREEEQLRQLAAAAASSTPENIFEPRGQVLEYVFSQPILQQQPPPPPRPMPALLDDDVQVTSLTVSDTGRASHHRVRHHHGSPNWLLKRLAHSAA